MPDPRPCIRCGIRPRQPGVRMCYCKQCRSDMARGRVSKPADKPCARCGTAQRAQRQSYCLPCIKQRWIEHGKPVSPRTVPPPKIWRPELPCSRCGSGVRAEGSYCTACAKWYKNQNRPFRLLGGYTTAHQRIRATRGRAADHQCEHRCGRPAAHWAYDHSHPDPHERVTRCGLRYSHSPDRYIPLCASCHKRFDNAERSRQA